MQEFNCPVKCAECCKWIWVDSPPEGTRSYKRLKDWGAVRGLWRDGGSFGSGGLLVANVCPQLKDNRCSIYEDRPEACRDYNCKNDKILEKVKNERKR